eukprot:scaffold5808_cov128-Isochrysis_galbana.AAC.18
MSRKSNKVDLSFIKQLSWLRFRIPASALATRVNVSSCTPVGRSATMLTCRMPLPRSVVEVYASVWGPSEMVVRAWRASPAPVQPRAVHSPAPHCPA